jgi:hypothetical protein
LLILDAVYLSLFPYSEGAFSPRDLLLEEQVDRPADFAPVPDESFKLRLTAAIQEKLRKYQQYLRKGLVYE